MLHSAYSDEGPTHVLVFALGAIRFFCHLRRLGSIRQSNLPVPGFWTK